MGAIYKNHADLGALTCFDLTHEYFIVLTDIQDVIYWLSVEYQRAVIDINDINENELKI